MDTTDSIKSNSKRKKTLLIILGVVIILAIAWFTFLGDLILGLLPEPDDPNLFPFGEPTIIDREGGPGTGPDGGPGGEVIDQQPQGRFARQRLRQITDFAVTDFGTVDTDMEILSQETLDGYNEAELLGVNPAEYIIDEFIPVPQVQYNARTSGIIYDSEVGTTITRVTRSTTILPGAAEAFFDITRRVVWMRYFSRSTYNIETFAGSLSEPVDAFACTQSFLTPVDENSSPDYIREVKQILNIARGTNLIENGEYNEAFSGTLESLRTQLRLDLGQPVGEAILPTLREFCARLDLEAQNQEPGSMDGQLINPNITHMDQSPDGNRYFILHEVDDVAEGYVTDQTGTNQQRVFRSAFTEWLPQWVTSERITLQTKASNGIDGYLFDLNPITKRVIKLIGPIPGLTTLTSPDGKHVLLSRSIESGFGNTVAFQVFHLDDRTVNDFEVKTFPEKCVWGSEIRYVYCAVPRNLPNVDYPDAWYQDLVSFTDDFWRLDTQNGTAELLFNPTQARAGAILDVTLLQLSASEDFIFFVNKIDGTLWSLEIDGL